jgi:acyl-CoA thioesterase FadM
MIEVVTFLRERPVARVRLDYEVRRDGEPEPIAAGYTIHGFINAATGRPTRAPAQFVEALEKAMSR